MFQPKPPAYSIGDPVAVLTQYEEHYLDLGYVVGCELNPTNWYLKGYVYAVVFTHGPSKGYRDWAHETEMVSVTWLCGLTPLQMKQPRCGEGIAQNSLLFPHSNFNSF